MALSTSSAMRKGEVGSNLMIISKTSWCCSNQLIKCWQESISTAVSEANSSGCKYGISAPYFLEISAYSAESVETITLSTYLLFFPASMEYAIKGLPQISTIFLSIILLDPLLAGMYANTLLPFIMKNKCDIPFLNFRIL